MKPRSGLFVTFGKQPQQSCVSDRSLKRNFSELTLQCKLNVVTSSRPLTFL